MNIAIITLYHGSENYGGLFQAYALQKYLETLGNTVEQIDYEKEDKKAIHGIFNKINKYGISYCVRRCFEIPISIYRRRYDNDIIKKYDGYFAQKKNKFAEFRNSIPHTELYNVNTISDINQKYDMYVAGSDQVWNPEYWCDAYFLNCVKEKRKVAIAASTGVEKISKRHDSYLKQCLQGFEYISVREYKSKICINSHFAGDISVVIDPVFLLDVSEWKEIENEYDLEFKDYIFCYLLGKEKKIHRKVKRISNKLGLPVVYLCFSQPNYYKEECNFGDVRLYDVGPREFIYLLRKSQYVVTDSFHGTAFSILFNKQFWTLPRYHLGIKKSSDRIKTILDMLDIRDRMISIASVRKWNDGIQWEHTNQKLKNVKERMKEEINKLM